MRMQTTRLDNQNPAERTVLPDSENFAAPSRKGEMVRKCRLQVVLRNQGVVVWA